MIVGIVTALAFGPASVARAGSPWASCTQGLVTPMASRCATSKSHKVESSRDWVTTEGVEDSQRILSETARGPAGASGTGYVQIKEVDAEKGLALVSYVYPSGEGSRAAARTSWVNIDTLGCSRSNIAHYSRSQDLPLSAETCVQHPLMVGGRLIQDVRTLPESTGTLIASRARRYSYSFQSAARDDMEHLASFYRSGDAAADASRLKAARDRLDGLLKRARLAFPHGYCDGDPKGRALIQMQRTCRMLVDAVSYLDRHFPPGADSETVTSELLSQITALSNPNRSGTATTADLSLRNILYYGLNGQERERANLTLLRENAEFDANDHGGEFMELHNGYVFGGFSHTAADGSTSRASFSNGIDCSQFVDDVFGIDKLWFNAGGGKRVRGSEVNADTFEDIARYHDGTGPKPTAPEAQALLNCFALVDLRQGDVPHPSDIVTFPGHMVLVRSYDADHGTISTYEAGGGTFNTVGSNMRPLFEPPCVGTSYDADSWDTRPVKAGLRVLRFTPGNGCPVRVPTGRAE